MGLGIVVIIGIVVIVIVHLCDGWNDLYHWLWFGRWLEPTLDFILRDGFFSSNGGCFQNGFGWKGGGELVVVAAAIGRRNNSSLIVVG